MLTISVSIMSLTLNFSLILSHGFSLSLFRLQLSLLFSESISRIFTFILSWNAFAWPLLILTRDDWYPVTVSIYSFVREVGPNFNLLMAACLIAIFPILVLYFFTQKLFLESISNFGLKQ